MIALHGTKEAPARTCKDLALANQQLPSGMYWIDPNLGSSLDAVEAFCDMDNKRTCISANPSQINNGKRYIGRKKRVWFSQDVSNGFKFSYVADAPQMAALQLLSTHAYQNVTFHCRNSVAYYDSAGKSHNKAAIFSTADDRELGASDKRFSYSVPTDNCKDRSSVWAQTVFEFSVNKAVRLPIDDISLGDLGSDQQQFGLDIGPVCFS
jgi:hypothetical protein